MGTACIHCSLVLLLSWVPSLQYLAGAEWATAKVAGLTHRVALLVLAAYPLVVGWRLKGSKDLELVETWAWRCLAPIAAYAVFSDVTVRVTSHIGRGTVLLWMVACLPLALYGRAMRAEAVRASSAKSSARP